MALLFLPRFGGHVVKHVEYDGPASPSTMSFSGYAMANGEKLVVRLGRKKLASRPWVLSLRSAERSDARAMSWRWKLNTREGTPSAEMIEDLLDKTGLPRAP